jgi:hypothetical protein
MMIVFPENSTRMLLAVSMGKISKEDLPSLPESQYTTGGVVEVSLGE